MKFNRKSIPISIAGSLLADDNNDGHETED